MNNTAANVSAEKIVSDVMTTYLVTLRLDDTLRLADDMLNLTHVRHFPVMDGDKLAGVVNQDDLLHASMAALVRQPKRTLRKVLGAVAVKEVMKPATTIASGTPIHDAAEIMVERGIECLLVLDDGKLVGLVTRTDLLRELAKR
jgi:acetoin utilization protein AcuB